MSTIILRRAVTALTLAAGLIASPLVLSAAAHAEENKLDPAAVRASLEGALNGFIRPAYHDLHDKAASLSKATETLCASPSAAAKTASDQAFAALVGSWSGIEFLQYGPALDSQRFDRIFFFPDRKGLGLKQVQSMLTKKDESIAGSDGIAGKSVAIQGLAALDYLLGGTGSDSLASAEGAYRCRFALAVARNVEGLSSELVAAWDDPQGISASFAATGASNKLFRDDRDAATALLGFFVHGMELVRDKRLKIIRAGKDQPVDSKAAAFWRTGQTWSALAANLDGVSRFWKAAHMEGLLPQDQRSTAQSIAFVLKGMQRVAAKLTIAPADLAGSQADLDKLDFLLVNANDVLHRMSEDYGKAIGLAAGFSFGDGD